MNELDLLEKIKEAYQEILAEKLVGIYVHGSVAFGCFRWEMSDIDFLVVVKDGLKQEEKEALISELLTLDAYAPQKGFEMSVVLEEVCKPFVYPTPYELHFSNSYREQFKQDLKGLCETLHGVDKDLAAHFTVIKAAGFPLCGPAVEEVFGEVPKENYLDSLIYDIENADKEIGENPVYFILNLCRVLAYLEEGLVLSKKQGGEWGAKQLPKDYRGLVAAALNAYTKDAEWGPTGEALEACGKSAELQQAEESGEVCGESAELLQNEDVLKRFAADMLARIRRKVEISV